jgi:hypothetical protein
MSNCKKCGAVIGNGAEFCPNCGNALKPEKSGKFAGKALFLLFGLIIGGAITGAVLFALGFLKFGNPKTVEGKGYDSAEEAVIAYAEYLKDGDMDGVISTFAMESLFEDYDIKENFKYTNAYNLGGGLSYTRYLPLIGESQHSWMLNMEGRRSYISQQMYLQYIYVNGNNVSDDVLRERLTSFNPLIFTDDFTINDAVSFLKDDPKFDTITIGKIIDNDDFDGVSQEGVKNFSKQIKKLFGADDAECVCLEIEIDDEEYVLFMTVVCYDGKWYNAQFNSAVSYSLGLNALHGGLILADEIDL